MLGGHKWEQETVDNWSKASGFPFVFCYLFFFFKDFVPFSVSVEDLQFHKAKDRYLEIDPATPRAPLLFGGHPNPGNQSKFKG